MLNEFLSMFWSVSSRVPSYYFKARRATPFNEFRTNCFKSVQGNRWRDSIKLFKDIFIAYTRKRAETRNIYHHFIAVHLEATQSHGLNNLASDRSRSSYCEANRWTAALTHASIESLTRVFSAATLGKHGPKNLAWFNGAAFSAEEFKHLIIINCYLHYSLI